MNFPTKCEYSPADIEAAIAFLQYSITAAKMTTRHNYSAEELEVDRILNELGNIIKQRKQKDDRGSSESDLCGDSDQHLLPKTDGFKSNAKDVNQSDVAPVCDIYFCTCGQFPKKKSDYNGHQINNMFVSRDSEQSTIIQMEQVMVINDKQEMERPRSNSSRWASYKKRVLESYIPESRNPPNSELDNLLEIAKAYLPQIGKFEPLEVRAAMGPDFPNFI